MRFKEERDLKAEQAAILSTEGVFKDLYSRWLDAGGEHDIPATLNGWVKLQNNLFEKWSSPAGERVGVGEGTGAVRAERSTAAGDPSTVRFPVSMKGRISRDGILIGEQLVVRLRLWPDGSVGWRASAVAAATTDKVVAIPTGKAP